LQNLSVISASKDEDINIDESWFAVVWSLIKQTRFHPQADTSEQKNAAN